MSRNLTRRRFLNAAAVLGAAGFSTAIRSADDPPVRNPRTTDGDEAAEPDWSERLTVTVGRDKADIAGTSDKALQAAVDYVARLGGGTVHVLPGTYRLRNAVYLPSKVRILGSGVESVLVKEPSVGCKLAADSDWSTTMDSVRQDLVRMPEMSEQELRALMPAHRDRVVRLMEMHRSMMGT